jgi:hypothetical protein
MNALSPELQADLTVEQMREVCALISKYRQRAAPFDIIHFGTTTGRSWQEDAKKEAAFAEAESHGGLKRQTRGNRRLRKCEIESAWARRKSENA